MEKHYFLTLEGDMTFAVRYGLKDGDNFISNHVTNFSRARIIAWWKNRKLTKMREFNDRQSQLFSGETLALPEE